MTNIIKKPAESATPVITHEVTPITVNTDAGAYAKVGWFVVLAGFLGFVLWAFFAPLDKGVPLSGHVVKESNRKVVQNLQPGTVQEILVKDGDVVKAGQVLVRMNDVQVGAQYQSTLAQYIGGRAIEARLVAEESGASKLAFPAALLPYKDDPRVKEQMSLQAELFTSRRESLHSDQAAMSETIEGLRAQVQGLTESRDAKKAQLGFLKEQLENSRDLAKEGYIPRARLLELERTAAQLSGAISEDIGNIARLQRQIAESTLRRSQRMADYQKEVRTQLSETRREAEAMESRIKGQAFELNSVEVKAPADGVVVGSNVFTKGAVVGAGSHLMDVVPDHDSLVVEGQLAVNLVDRVHPGLPVELIFSAFNTNKTPHIAGELIHVDADRTLDERNNVSYYKVRARVTKEGAKMIADKKLQVVSGMPVEMFVKTGERTMASYLLKPVFDRAHSAMSED